MLKQLTITLLGRPCSKKNSRDFRRSKFGGYTVPGQNYEKFRSSAISQLQIVRLVEKFGGMPVYVEYEFYKLGISLQDVDNAMGSINDILQDKLVKIIDDDKQILAGKFNIWPGGTAWKTVVHIRQLYCNKGEHDINPETMICDICGLTDQQILLFK